MNEKQAKRIRRAAHAFVRVEQKSLEKGRPANEQADLLGNQLHMMWPDLNARQRGKISGELSRLGLARAVQRAIKFVLAAALLCILACGTPNISERTQYLVTDAAADAPVASCGDPRPYGAIGDGVHNDVEPLRMWLTACAPSAPATATLPAGVWLVGEHLSSLRCLELPAGITLVGETRDVTVKLATAQRDSVRPIYIGSPGAGVANLTIDGNKAAQLTDDEHRAGVIVWGATDVTIEHVTSIDSTGDGVYVGGSSSARITISDVDAYDNDRSGIALTNGGFITVSSSRLVNNAGQDFDTEPDGPPLHDITLEYTYIDAGTANTTSPVLAMAGAGIDPSKHSVRFNVHDNTIYGPASIIYVDDSVFTGNTVVQTMSANYAAVLMQGASTGVTISGNDLRLSSGSSARSVINVQGNGTIGQPSGLVIVGNTVHADTSSNLVAVLLNSIHDAAVTNNKLIGSPSSTFNYGVQCRSAAQGYPIASLVVDGNSFYDFPTGVIAFSGVSPMVPIAYVEADSNTFTSDTGRSSTTALALNYSAGGVYENAVQSARADGNTLQGVPNFIKPACACQVQ